MTTSESPSESRPESGAEPAASERVSGRGLTRRNMLRGSAAAVATFGLGAFLDACSSSGGTGTSSSSSSAATSSSSAAGSVSSSSSSAGSVGSSAASSAIGSSSAGSSAASSGPVANIGKISFGSNYSDPAPKAAFADLCTAATNATGVSVDINTVDHNTFQNNISSYLQGQPQDLFTWFAGYRVQTFAKQGLIQQIDDVWDKIGGSFPDAVKNLSKGADGHYYLVPIYNYPWVVFYNKSTFTEKGYTVPTTWDQMIALCKKMKTDGLIPFALGQKDGWPALGTFDILNMRINGYDYHIKLCQHQIPWTDKGVTAVFNQWAELVPYVQTGATGRVWQDAAKTLESKQAGMIFQGTNQIAAQYVTDKKSLDDLDFFVYPEINSQYGQDAIDAPADGFCLAQKSGNQDLAKKVLEYIGTASAEATYLKSDQWDVAVASGATVPTYNSIQTKSVQVISQAKQIAQFLDRDSDGGFADTQVAQAIDTFLQSPTPSTISTIQTQLEAQAKQVFTS